jgi:hypothetical protein
MRPYVLKGKVEEDFTAITLTVNWIDFLDRGKRKDQAFQKQRNRAADCLTLPPI